MPTENIIIQFGIETEIGIARDGEENLDVVAESMALVRSATKSGVLMRWDYECEDPHADMRGFHVEELRQDTDEAHYFAQDSAAGTELRGNQKRPGAGQRRALLQRPRPPGILHAGMQHAGRTGRAGPRRRTHPDALRAETFRGTRLHGPPLQEQHRFSRPQLRLP